MSHFYRYLQPLEYDFNSYAVKVDPKGGICFRVINEGDDKGYKLITVSAAICPDDELFNQKIAKYIADNGFASGSTFSLHVSSLACNVIALALVNLSRLVKEESSPHDLYRNLHLHNLAQKIEQLRATHERAWQLDKTGLEIVQALDLKNYYAKNQDR